MDQETITSIRHSSLIFFCVLASAYLLSWLLWKNDIVPHVTQLIAENSAIPLYAVGTAVIVSSSALYLDTRQPEQKPTFIAVCILTGALFVGLTLLDLFSRT